MVIRRMAAVLLIAAAASTGASAPLFAGQGAASRPAGGEGAPVRSAPGQSSAAGLQDAALQQAVDEFKASKTRSPRDGYAFSGEFLTASGEPFVALQFLLPRNSSLVAGQTVTFFGSIEDEAGRPIRTFEDPVKLTGSKGDLLADRSVVLPAGKARAYLGVAASGKPVAMTVTDLIIAAPPDRNAPAISRLILSNDVYPLPVAQRPDEPFAFGGIKVIPKADRTFHAADELWYFFELRNPGIDLASNGARIQVKLDITGQGTDGKPFTPRTSLPREVDAQPLKGVPGHYGVGSSMPLTGFRAGDYTIKVRVNDTVRKSTSNLQENFKIAGEEK